MRWDEYFRKRSIVSGISKMGPRDIRDVLYAPAMSYAFGPWKERVVCAVRTAADGERQGAERGYRRVDA